MKERRNWRYKLFFASFIILLLLAGCTQLGDKVSAGTKEFSGALPTTNETLETSLKKINTDFYNYDLKYNANKVFEMVAFTEVFLTEMETQEKKIKEEMQNVKKLNTEYESSKQGVVMEQLDKGSKSLMTQIENKFSDFAGQEQNLDSCQKNMGTYREFIDMTRQNSLYLEELGFKTNLLSDEMESKDYDDALNTVEELKELNKKIKSNGKQRTDTGIFEFNEKILGSWDLFNDAWDEYMEYINLVKSENLDEAALQFDAYAKKYTEAVQASQDESLLESLNTVHLWYQDNIGVCSDVFDGYA